MQHIATLLAQYLQAPAKRWQPGRNIGARTWPNDYNIMQHPQMLREKFDHFQI